MKQYIVVDAGADRIGIRLSTHWVFICLFSQPMNEANKYVDVISNKQAQIWCSKDRLQPINVPLKVLFIQSNRSKRK